MYVFSVHSHKKIFRIFRQIFRKRCFKQVSHLNWDLLSYTWHITLINVSVLYINTVNTYIFTYICIYLRLQISKSTTHVLSNDYLVTPPAQRVQFILGEEVGDDAHESHPLFSEMEELVKDGDEMEWKETAR